MKRIATQTLGCKLNFAETSDMLRRFVEKGWRKVDFDEEADLYVINTCTVTATAEKKCRNAIRQATRHGNNAIVAVVGCFAQNAAPEIEKIEGVDLIVGNGQKHRLPDIVERMLTTGSPCITPENEEPTSFDISFSRDDRTRTFFKIQDGCDYFCTYCAIPFARGRSRSATVAETIKVARQIASTGTKEVVLTGINTGTFGQSHGETLLDLLRELDRIEPIKRFRISSIEPNLITNDIIDFVSTSRAFLPHFHIPLQAGSDTLLKAMHRKYTTAFYASLVDKIKTAMPDACIATDIMAGFHGETEEEFQHVLAFVESIPISYLHVFTYSERPNTAALRMSGRIAVHQRREHSQRLHILSEKKKKAFYQSQQHSIRPVLWESDIKDNLMYGFTDNYIRVRKKHDENDVNNITPFSLDKLIYDEEVFESDHSI